MAKFQKGNKASTGGYSRGEHNAAKAVRHVFSEWTKNRITWDEVDVVYKAADSRTKFEIWKFCVANFPPREGEGTSKGIQINYVFPPQI